MYNDESAKRVSLSIQLDEARQRTATSEAQLARLKGLPDQLAAVQAELQKLRFDNSLANGKSNQLEDKMAG